MRAAAVGLLLFVGGTGLGCNRVEPRALAPASDVLLVTIDTLRADHVGAYGADFARTPVLDGLARRGVRFETAIAAAPITLPSHATLLTGVRPPRHGVRHNGTFKLGDELPTLAERFRAAGYATGAVVGAVVLRARYGLARGFDHYDDRQAGRKAGAAGFPERSAREVTDAALAWLARSGPRPVFLWVHYYDPHQEHRAPEPFASALAGRPYDAEIAYTDHELGRLLEGFAGRGAARGPLVTVTSDHGESLGEHGETTHGLTLYDAALRVPWLLAGPDVPEGQVVEGVARAVDLAPTLLSLAGLSPLPEADGVDLSRSFASGRIPDDRWAYAESLLPQLDFGWAPLHAVRTRDRLYVRAPRPELYDLERDPGQRQDRSAEPASGPTLATLDARVSAVLAEGGAANRVALDADERARLQALGYALPEETVAETGLDPKDGVRHQALVQQGARALAQGRYAEAEKALRAFLEVAPGSARAHGLLASTLLYTGRAQEGLEHADRAIAIDPRPAHRYADRAEIRLVAGDVAGARRDFEHALALDPDDAWVQMGAMWLRIEDGDLGAAVGHARRAFELAPVDPFVRLRVGLLFKRAGAYRPALESFQEAVRLRPDFEMAQMRLAVELARIGDVGAAHVARQQAGTLASDPALGSELLMALAAAGDLDGARALGERLGGRHPDDPRVARARRFLEERAARGPAQRGGA